MLKQKRLKKLLGEGYEFKVNRSPEVVCNLLKSLTGSNYFLVVAALTGGGGKLEAVLFWQNGNYRLGYDLMVKDTPDSPEWICYENLQEEVHYNAWNLEREMFLVLDRAVVRLGMSYTECHFPKLNNDKRKVNE